MRKRWFLPVAAVFGLACGQQDDRLRAGAGDASRGPYPDAAPSSDGTASDSASPSEETLTPITPEEIAIAGQLQGAFLELDCASEEIELQFCHPKDMGVENIMLRFGGEPGQSYAVVLGVWGVVEGAEYKNGTSAGEHFYIGGIDGTRAIGTSGLPAEYGLAVGSETYHLNYFEFGAGEHYTYGIEYVTPPITIPGASTLMLFVRSPDDMINTNHMESGVMNPPLGLRDKLDNIKSQPLQGQFVYLEAERVTMAK